MWWPPLCPERPRGRIDNSGCLRVFDCSIQARGELFLSWEWVFLAQDSCRATKATNTSKPPFLKGRNSKRDFKNCSKWNRRYHISPKSQEASAARKTRFNCYQLGAKQSQSPEHKSDLFIFDSNIPGGSLNATTKPWMNACQRIANHYLASKGKWNVRSSVIGQWAVCNSRWAWTPRCKMTRRSAWMHFILGMP